MKHKNQLRILVEQSASPACCYCGESDITKFTLEHLTPTIRGGTNDPKNLAISCVRCNNKKGCLTDREFRFLREQDSHRLPVFKQRLIALIDPFYEVKESHLQHQEYKQSLKSARGPVCVTEFTEQQMMDMSKSRKGKDAKKKG